MSRLRVLSFLKRLPRPRRGTAGRCRSRRLFLACLPALVLTVAPVGPARADDTAETKSGSAPTSRAPEKGCEWEMVQSSDGSFRVRVQQCDFGFRKVTHSIRGSTLVQKLSDSPEPDVLIELFEKDPTESPEAVLKRLFVQKLDDYERLHCVPRRSSPEGKPVLDQGKEAWCIGPDKEYSRKIERETPEGDMPNESCGPHGDPVDSRAYFEFHSTSPGRFAWVVIGQDDPLFDAGSVVF